MQKILVTGATGFIGNYVIEVLLQRGFSVIATSSNIEKAKQFNWFNKVNYAELDFDKLDNNTNYFEYFNKPELLIHLAWQGLPNYKDQFHLTKNLPQHQLFLSNIIANGLKDVTAIGTCFEYGMQEGELNEKMECFPDNAYAKAKNDLRIYLETLNINLKWVRLFYMYGKGQNQKSLIAQLETALANNENIFNMSGGEQIRDFMPVEEVAENIATIAIQTRIVGVINCSSGQPITVKEFVENYLQQKNKVIKMNLGFYPYADFEPMNFWGNNDKLKSIIEKK
ncbi:MAG: NAD-dependent epimerase/dehydratase family protein [Chitinophagaceae bacterium]